MEIQTRLLNFDEEFKFENMRHLEKLEEQDKYLEKEKRLFIEVFTTFTDSIKLTRENDVGRPRFEFEDIVKCLLIMCYHGFSYRRAESDIIDLKEKGIISKVPQRSTLNKYMCMPATTKVLEKLIQFSSMLFIEQEDTLILDSSWLAPRMYTGGYRKVYDKANAPLAKVRKIHIACLKNSKIIACAKSTEGTKHDSPFFKELILKVVKNGFNITSLLADAGYSGKENYAFCETLNIKNIFIDFKKNATLRRAKSNSWRKQLTLLKENPDIWKEHYRFRVVVEQVFSSIKRKQTNYLRARIGTSQDNELLLKCLVYNLCIIGKYS